MAFSAQHQQRMMLLILQFWSWHPQYTGFSITTIVSASRMVSLGSSHCLFSDALQDSIKHSKPIAYTILLCLDKFCFLITNATSAILVHSIYVLTMREYFPEDLPSQIYEYFIPPLRAFLYFFIDILTVYVSVITLIL